MKRKIAFYLLFKIGQERHGRGREKNYVTLFMRVAKTHGYRKMPHLSMPHRVSVAFWKK